jgi:hypothetical protein
LTLHVTMLGRFELAVDGVPGAEGNRARRHAAAVVKVLALAPGRRLHREQVRPHATGGHRARALSLRGDLLNALGDPMAVSAYREALDGAAGDEVRGLRVRLSRMR